MTIYKKKQASALKWILAIIIFVLGMTLTMSDVYGFAFPNNSNEGSTYGAWHDRDGNTGYNDSFNYDHTWSNNTYSGGDNSTTYFQPPCAVPEPSTILLLSAGLGALWVARRQRTK